MNSIREKENGKEKKWGASPESGAGNGRDGTIDRLIITN